MFDCGAGPVTITVTSQITFTKETVLDGGGLVTLSGGGTTRILYLDSDYNTPTPRLTVQRLSFRDGKSPAVGEDTAQGGGAIYRDGGSLTVIDSMFDNNHGPATGQDVAGGAIYGFGGGETIIVGSTFTNNAASDGGAVGSLNGDLTVINSSFIGNAATGTGGNPGDGGCGGALYMDGRDETTSLCGVVAFGSNGGGVWLGIGPTGTMLNCTIARNRSTAMNQIAGAIFGEGLTLVNTIVAENTAMYTPSCNVARPGGSGNLQWPGGSLCTESPLVADPQLGALADNGGDAETLLPAASSPARGIGTGCPPTDQLGNPRAEPCTAGAVEAP